MTSFAVPGAVLDTELSDEGGRPVVQLHGLTSSRASDRVLDLDLGRGLSGTRLLRYDARGHGRSTGRPVPADFTWEALASDLLRLLEDRFPGEQVHGVGPSMGCATLLHAAVREPERFSGLTLLLPPTAWEGRRAQADAYLRRADLVERHGLERLLAEDRRAPRPPATVGTPDIDPDISPTLLPSAYRGAARSDLPAPERIAALRLPVTILAWTGDSGHPVSTARALATLLPDARAEIAERPEQVAAWPKRLRDDVAGRPAVSGG
ncbi:alpha/beta fold hydrolase [Brachybacterium sp. DNPG3]